MKEYNIQKLIEASYFSKDLPYEVKDALLNFLIETGGDIDSINIDDLIVNGLSCIPREDIAKYYTAEQIEDLYIIYDEDASLPIEERTSDVWILN